jgi:hypothetical protein
MSQNLLQRPPDGGHQAEKSDFLAVAESEESELLTVAVMQRSAVES